MRRLIKEAVVVCKNVLPRCRDHEAVFGGGLFGIGIVALTY